MFFWKPRRIESINNSRVTEELLPPSGLSVILVLCFANLKVTDCKSIKTLKGEIGVGTYYHTIYILNYLLEKTKSRNTDILFICYLFVYRRFQWVRLYSVE
jgi:hypothetical protein